MKQTMIKAVTDIRTTGLNTETEQRDFISADSVAFIVKSIGGYS